MKLRHDLSWCSVGLVLFAMLGCQPTETCTGQTGTGASPPTENNGAACKADAQCLSGYCIDGVCCNERCSATCKACNVPCSEGICSEVSAGACSTCAGTLAFSGPPLVPGTSQRFTIGDLDGDGITDMALSIYPGYSFSGISVIFGHGDGTFTLPIVVDSDLTGTGYGGNRSRVDIADLNGDGRPDLVAEDGTFMNQGQGVFTKNPPQANVVDMVAAADFNCDGLSDLVSIVYEQDYSAPEFHLDFYATVAMNSGNATFLPPTKYLVGQEPMDVVTPDLNGDGLLDLVVANANSHDISVLFNHGDGTFSQKTDYALKYSPHTMFDADLNNDGRVDLVIEVGYGHRVFVLINQGQGILAPPVEYPISTNETGAVIAADLDGDGWKDLVTTNVASESISVLINQGDGTFPTEVTYATTAYPIAVRAADFDRDGKLDLAISHGSAGIEVLINQGAGTFPNKTEILSGTNYLDVVATDLNGDNQPDVALLHNSVSTHAVEILHNQGNGTLVPGGAYPMDSSFYVMAVADVNADTFPDVVAGANVMPPNANILINQGNGSFVGGGALAFDQYLGDMVAGDIDGNGFVDIAVTNVKDSSISVFFNQGGGVFSPDVRFPTGENPRAMKIGDLNGDGWLDLAVVSMIGLNYSLLFNQGGGTFAPRVDFPTDDVPRGLEMADIDGNGTLDLLMVNYEGTKLSVLRGHGDGTFEPKFDYDIREGSSEKTLRIGDVNQDGAMDIFFASRGVTVDLFLNRGDGTFQEKLSYGAGVVPSAAALADIDGDGRPDFVVVHDSIPLYAPEGTRPESAVYLLMNQCMP